jgi:hypothetical protein
VVLILLSFFVFALAERKNEKPGARTQRVPGESGSTMLPSILSLPKGRQKQVIGANA